MPEQSQAECSTPERATRWAVVVGGVMVMVAVVFLILQAVLSSAIRLSSTRFLFTQFDFAYRNGRNAGEEPVANVGEFVDRVLRWKIDWNGCRREGRAICDSWGTGIKVAVEPSQIVLRSAGMDRRFDTTDDIVTEIPHVEPPAWPVMIRGTE